MDQPIKKFFKDFFGDKKARFSWFSFLRIVASAQVLFWPFALSKVLDILGQGIENWRKALVWVLAMIINKMLEDPIRLKSKHGIQTIGSELRLSLATFFSQETKLRSGAKTGEAVQRIKIANDNINSVTIFYKDSFLEIPTNLIVITAVFWSLSPTYLYLLLAYVSLYLILDHFTTNYYLEEAREYFEASETFWGTLYRKTPDVWRGREDSDTFAEKANIESESLKKELVTMDKANITRWTMLQVLSSFFKSFALALVFFRITQDQAAIGSMVLVLSYFSSTQASLNRITSSLKLFSELKISLHRLSQVIESKIS